MGGLDANVIKVRPQRCLLRLGSKRVGDVSQECNQKEYVTRKRRMKGVEEGVSLATVPKAIRPDCNLNHFGL